MNTKQLKQKILSLAISGQLVPQDPTDEPASELLKRIAAEKTANVPKGKKQKITKDTSHYQQYPPFELPKGWVWCKLGEVCDVENGYAFKSQDYKENGIPLIRISNIQEGKISLTNTIYIDKTVNEEFIVKRGDLLIAMSGATTGKMGIYENEEIAYLNQRVGNIRIKNEKLINNQYRDYCLMSQKDYILELAYGGAQPNISSAIISSLNIPLPPLAEQQRIVAEVDKLFTLIDQLEEDKTALQQLITQLKSKILSLAIHGQLVAQDANDTPAEELLKQINPEYKSSGNLHYKNLPKGWEVIPVKMVCKLKDGEKKENVKLPYLDVKYFRGKATSTIKENGKYIPKNTTLILVDGENSGEIFYASAEGYQGSTMKILEIEPIVDRAYILHFIKSYQKELKENKVGSAIPHLNKKLFGELQLPLPPFVEQQRIVERVEKLFKQLDAIQNALAI